MIWLYIIIGTFITTMVIATYYAVRIWKGQLHKYLAGRTALNDFGFSRLFTVDKAEIAVKLRKILQECSDINVSGIIPTDELCRDIGLGKIDCLDVVDFIRDIEKEFKIKIPDSEAKKMRTFNEVVEYIASNRSD